MKASIITVTGKGQITLPMDMRTAAKIKEGDKLLIIESKGNLTLQKVTEDDFADLRKLSLDHMAKFWSDPKDDVWDKVYKR